MENNNQITNDGINAAKPSALNPSTNIASQNQALPITQKTNIENKTTEQINSGSTQRNTFGGRFFRNNTPNKVATTSPQDTTANKPADSAAMPKKNNFFNKNSSGNKKPLDVNRVRAERRTDLHQNFSSINLSDADNKSPVAINVDTEKYNSKMPLAKKDSLKVMFLGGVGEIGKNITLLEYKDEIIIIDSGLSFPSEDLPGIDLVIPDNSYLITNKDKVKALFITHGHEDHIGSVPYLLADINVPVIYGSALSLALIENKLDEHPKVKSKFNGVIVKPSQSVRVGSFLVEFIKVNHSIAGSMALCITTPVGVVFHTGDFKIDLTPIDNEMIDLGRIAEIGKKGVLLLLCESTNVERAGYTMSEKTVGATLDTLFMQNKTQRIIVTTFASNTHRLQQILDKAEKYGRKVAFSGRSMLNVADTAIKLGYLHMNKNNLIEIDKIDKYPFNELCIITTGSQGEPMSALTRMSSGDFNKVEIGENDVIILSSSPIPGNEKMVNRVINNLLKKGAKIINDELADVHVSGHACREEIKLMHALIKPKFFIPVHGEFKHLKSHYDLAIEMGMESRNVLIPDIGYCVEVTDKYIKKLTNVPAGQRLVDGLGVGDPDSVVLHHRKQLAEDGLCVAIIGLDVTSGEITSGPEIISRGLIYNDEVVGLIYEAKETARNAIKECDLKMIDMSELKNRVRKALLNFFFKKTKRRPMILTIIIES